MLASFACGGSDSDPGNQGGGDVADGVSGSLPPGDNDSDYDDGSGWPRWKNPCPGPACDPPRMDREQVIYPPDDIAAPVPAYDGRGPRQIR